MSAFNSYDYAKHNFKYLEAVLHDIASRGKVGLGKSAVEHGITVDSATKARFAKFAGRPASLPIDEFNYIAASNTKPFKWSQIFKGTYSGIKHQTDGQYAEAGVAYIFNAIAGNKCTRRTCDRALAQIEKTLADKDMPADWIMSSKLSAQKLHQVIDGAEKYKAAHVDGNDISGLPENVLRIAKMFKSKSGIKQAIGSRIDQDALDGLYSTAKDTWNKADIVLVSDDLDLDVELAEKHFAATCEFNAFLNDLIERQLIVPVSLKKIAPKATLSQIAFIKEGNVKDADKTQSMIDDVQSVDIALPNAVSKDSKWTGTCYVKSSNGLRIDFRHMNTDRESLCIELKLKTSRGGKALNELKRKFGLMPNFYKSYWFPKQEDWLAEVYRLTGVKLQPKQSLVESDPLWFVRPAFKGLVALLDICSKNMKTAGGQVDLIQFFKLLYGCASDANSESIFWLLSMK